MVETICDFLTYFSTYKLSVGLFVIYCKFCLCRILAQIYFAVLPLCTDDLINMLYSSLLMILCSVSQT